MRMTNSQKVRTLFGAFACRSDIKRTLVRRYWSQHKIFNLDFAGIRAVFSTEDFYSNYWFFGPQNEIPVYEPAVTRLLISRLQSSRGFADLGANLGYFSVIAAILLK